MVIVKMVQWCFEEAEQVIVETDAHQQQHHSIAEKKDRHDEF